MLTSFLGQNLETLKHSCTTYKKCLLLNRVTLRGSFNNEISELNFHLIWIYMILWRVLMLLNRQRWWKKKQSCIYIGGHWYSVIDYTTFSMSKFLIEHFALVKIGWKRARIALADRFNSNLHLWILIINWIHFFVLISI